MWCLKRFYEGLKGLLIEPFEALQSFLRIWSYLLKKFLMENIIFQAVVGRFSELTIANKHLQVQCQQWTLHEKCPYSEFFWSAFSRIRLNKELNTEYLSLFIPSTGKYGPEKLRMCGHFSRSEKHANNVLRTKDYEK